MGDIGWFLIKNGMNGQLGGRRIWYRESQSSEVRHTHPCMILGKVIPLGNFLARSKYSNEIWIYNKEQKRREKCLKNLPRHLQRDWLWFHLERRSQNMRHLYPGMGLQLTVFRFPHHQNNHDLSGAYILRSEHEDKHVKHDARRSWTHFFFWVCFSICVFGKNPNTANWSSMDDDAITWGGIGVLGSPSYICGSVRHAQPVSCIGHIAWG